MADSAFTRHRDAILRQERLQALVLHLFNCDEWPFNLGYQLTALDEPNLRIALELMRAYWQHGENDPEFLALGRNLAEYRLAERERLNADIRAIEDEMRAERD